MARLLRPFATGSLRNLLSDEGGGLLSNEALITAFDLRLLEPELRPAAAMVCTETVWAAAAQDPKPRLLVVDEVWSIMQHLLANPVPRRASSRSWRQVRSGEDHLGEPPAERIVVAELLEQLGVVCQKLGHGPF